MLSLNLVCIKVLHTTFHGAGGKWQPPTPHNHNSKLKLKTFQKQPKLHRGTKSQKRGKQCVTCRVCVESGQHNTEDNTKQSGNYDEQSKEQCM